MAHPGILVDIVFVLLLSIGINLLFSKLHIPVIIGFLVVGIIAGPHSLALIHQTEEVELLAEIGIVLLMFTIGIEFSLKKIMHAGRTVLLGGFLQLLLITATTVLLFYILGYEINKGIFSGFLLTLSSTAIVLRTLQNQGELGTFHGQTSMSILIFQDLAIVPMILFVPFLANTANDGNLPFTVLLKSLLFIGSMLLLARWLIPKLFHQIALSRSRELFLLTVFVVSLGTALASWWIGLSLALGAFLAGLVISESEFSHQAFGDIIPFRDLFISFFFISIGMMLDIGFVWENLMKVIFVVVAVLIIKSVVTGFVAFLLGYPLKTTLIVGLALSQVGEFSFVLSGIGMEYGLITEQANQLFLSAAIITLSVTPFIIRLSPGWAEYLLKLPIPEKIKCGLNNLKEETLPEVADHLVIVGYGINGKNVALAAKYAGIKHVIIELNPETVREEFARGETIIYGDASQTAILHEAKVEKAAVIVITVPNPSDAKLTTMRARELNPSIHIIVRTRFISDREELHRLGANEVVPEEFETSLAIFKKVLSCFTVPDEEIDTLTQKLRDNEFEALRLPDSIPGIKDDKLKVQALNDYLLHRTVLTDEEAGALNRNPEEWTKNGYLRIIGVVRNHIFHPDPSESFRFQQGDTLYYLGNLENMNRLLDNPDKK
ncbi:MAG: cation:proton antiporter [Bacteroidales bacterium]